MRAAQIVRRTPQIMPRNRPPRAPIVPAMRRNQTPRVRAVRHAPIVPPAPRSPTALRVPERIARPRLTPLRRRVRPPTGRAMQRNRTTPQNPAIARPRIRALRSRRSMRIDRPRPSRLTLRSQPNGRRELKSLPHLTALNRSMWIGRPKPRHRLVLNRSVRLNRNELLHSTTPNPRRNSSTARPRVKASLRVKTIRHTEGDNCCFGSDKLT